VTTEGSVADNAKNFDNPLRQDAVGLS